VRLSKEAVIRGYEAAVVLTFGLIAVFAITGLTARPTLLALLAVPLALPVRRALRESYDQPYALMPAMGKNIQLHLVTGLLLIAGYVIAIVADHAFSHPPFFLS
jgi:1,4-dihydroxy-2-naphthoate octaprenyltransferase